MSGNEELVSIVEAGRVLGVSESTVWRMIRRGVLPSLRKGGRRLVPRRALHKGVAPAADADRVPALTADHPIFRLVGAGRSGGQAPGARDKHALLDE
jgi:excisionase family DNA binding protein